MKFKIEVIRVKAADFQGDEGETIPYGYVKAERLDNNSTIEFGTKYYPEYEVGKEYEPELEKIELPGRKPGTTRFAWKEPRRD